METLIQFFDLHRFVPGDLLVIGTLIILEGLLSCDNAVALAMLVRSLPKEQQGKALRYGIIGAYVFLFIALLMASWIVSLWYLKILGGLYLLWIAGKHFLVPPDNDEAGSGGHKIWIIPGLGIFWSTVVSVELTDIAFSVDSIAAAVAFSDKFFVLVIAGMIYILVMRFAAQGFIKLLAKFPRLETAAFIAVGIIGLKLLFELPGDVIGLRDDHRITANSAVAYKTMAHSRMHDLELMRIPHVITITRASLAEPVLDNIPETGRERRDVTAFWNLEGRPLVHLDEKATAILIIFVFALGFLGRRRQEPEDPKAT